MELSYLATFAVALVSSILSGLAHGGGGFVMGPYWLIAGMTPAQGATTGAFTSIGMSVSSVAAFHKSDHLPQDRRLLITLSTIAVIAAVIGALVLPHIDVSAYKTALALITLGAVPLLFVQSSKLATSTRNRSAGLVILSLLIAVGSIITSSTFSILFALTLMSFFGMSVMQTTALRRFINIGQSIVLFIVLAAQGFFLWQHGLMALAGGAIGSYIGTRYAIKRGERFAKYALATISVVGACILLM